jgi:hypothetical protein
VSSHIDRETTAPAAGQRQRGRAWGTGGQYQAAGVQYTVHALCLPLSSPKDPVRRKRIIQPNPVARGSDSSALGVAVCR